MRLPLPASPQRRKLIAAVRGQYARLHKDLALQLASLPDPELRNINVAQNVMRDCMTAVMNEMMPYTHLTPLELAKRLASYALSSVPLEDQDAVVASHVQSFADFHMSRTAAGTIIPADWRMEDGTERPNFPEN